MGKRERERKGLQKALRFQRRIADRVARSQDVSHLLVSEHSSASDHEESRRDDMEEESSAAAEGCSSQWHEGDDGCGSSTSPHLQMSSDGWADGDHEFEGRSSMSEGGEQDEDEDEDEDESSIVGEGEGESEDKGEGEDEGEDSNLSRQSDEGEVTAAQLRVAQREEHRRQRRALMSRLVGDSSGMPSMLHCNGEHPMPRVVFALPGFVPAKESAQGRGRSGARLDLSRITLPGATAVRAEDDTAQFLWFCDCSAQHVVIKRTAEALHTMAGGCSEVQSADCECVQYCQAILSKSGMDVGDMIRMSPMHYCNEDVGHAPGE